MYCMSGTAQKAALKKSLLMLESEASVDACHEIWIIQYTIPGDRGW